MNEQQNIMTSNKTHLDESNVVWILRTILKKRGNM